MNRRQPKETYQSVLDEGYKSVDRRGRERKYRKNSNVLRNKICRKRMKKQV